MHRDHWNGFKREETFHLILQQALDDTATIKARTIKRIIAHVAPEFLEGLFIPRPCVRKLRYVGCGDVCCEFPNGDTPHGDGLVLGQVYESETFNGAVYKLKGRDRVVGASHFEWIRDEE